MLFPLRSDLSLARDRIDKAFRAGKLPVRYMSAVGELGNMLEVISLWDELSTTEAISVTASTNGEMATLWVKNSNVRYQWETVGDLGLFTRSLAIGDTIVPKCKVSVDYTDFDNADIYFWTSQE
jgi:hypothetical protein